MTIEKDALMPMQIPAMNAVHEEERVLLNEITADLKAAEIDQTTIDAKLDELFSHTVAHFEMENRNMEQIQFPPYPVHKGEHELALQTMQQEIDAWKSARGLTRLQQYLEVELPEWLVQHISTMDNVTSHFFKRIEDSAPGTLDFSLQ